MSIRRVYMDWAASTPLHPQAVRVMRKVEGAYGNPSAPHEEGRRSRDLIETARIKIARVLSVKAGELIFTGSGTESNNIAIRGIQKPAHIVTTAFEHPSVEGPIALWEREGVRVTRVAPDAQGLVTSEAVLAALTSETTLVSIVLVQSEIGTVQPIREISRVVKAKHPHVCIHADASQAPLWMDASPHALGADLATYDAQKIMGPKGVGLLWRAPSVDLTPVVRGGSQERGIRPGTENVVAIVGMAEAFERTLPGRAQRALQTAQVRDYFIELLREIPQAKINGSLKHRVPNNVHISIPGVDGDYLAVLMDARGIAVSARSACVTDGSPSVAVRAIGESESHTRGTLRFTFGPSVTKSDAKRAIAALKGSLAIAGKLTIL